MNELTDKYKRLSPREHVLKRPGMYVGNTQPDDIEMFICNDTFSKIEKKLIKFNAGFIKLFDEILTNASDHCIRTNGAVKNIEIIVDKINNLIVIKNDGPSVPIQQKDGIWIPQMLFAELMTGENYDDTQDRFVGGMNGVGAALTNILSKKFIIECCDGIKSYKQICENNLEIINDPVIKKAKDKSYTQISYEPDLKFFNMESISTDDILCMQKRAMDIAVYAKCNIFFNNTKIPVKNLNEYAKLHLEEESVIYSETVNDRFDLCVTESFKDNFEHVSIVNGISTHIGGSHVNFISNQIINGLIDEMTKGNKKLKIRASDVKSKLFLFLVSKIPNPTFDTQTKENLTTKMSKDITLDATVTPQFIKKLAKSSIVQSILDWLALKEAAELSKISKASGKKVKIAKLEDAYNAGTSKSIDCALFLAEGECIDENTIIKVFKDDDYVSIKVKDVNIGDMVITHNGNIRQIYGITKKVKKCLKINYNNTSISCSYEHKLLVYNKITKKFMYLKVSDIDKAIHQLVKSKLFNLESVIEIKNIESIDDDKFKLRLFINNSYIDTSLIHKFTILNIDYNKFELKTADNLNKGDLLISISPS